MQLAIDTETTGLDFHHGAKPFFVTVCNEEDEVTYWEADVDPLTREPQWSKEDIQEIQETIRQADKRILQNSKFDVKALKSIGVNDWDWSNTHDTLIAGHLLASNQPHDLTSMALVYLGINIKPYEEALNTAITEARRIARAKYPKWLIAKQGLACMPSAKDKCSQFDMWLPRAVAKEEGYPEDHPWWTVLSGYSNADSSVTLPLWKVMMKNIAYRKLTALYEERLKVLPIIHAMEVGGATVNAEHVKELEDTYTESCKESSRICCDLSGGMLTELPKGLTNDLRSVMKNHLKLVSPKATKKGAESYDKYVIDEWLVTLPEGSDQHTFVKHLAHYRKRQTALSYIETYKKFWRPLEGREGWYTLYSSLNPTGTDTLRMSSENPNQQQISKQELAEAGKPSHSARYMFGPAPGREWWSCDGQNLELRLPAYEAGEEAMIVLFEKPNEPPYFGSNHLLFFDILHPDKWDRSDPEGLLKAKKKYASTWYQWTKNGDFAVQYGAVASSGTADRAYHVPGGQAKIEKHLSKIKLLSEKQIALAEQKGYVETMPDKTVDPLRGYPILCTRSAWGSIVPTVPLSYHVQGTAMWWMMKAMIRVHEFLETLNKEKGRPNHYRIVMQIHDELVFDFPRGLGKDSWKTNRHIMEEVQRLMAMGGNDIGVPTPVSCEYHSNNWGKGLSV